MLKNLEIKNCKIIKMLIDFKIKLIKNMYQKKFQNIKKQI